MGRRRGTKESRNVVSSFFSPDSSAISNGNRNQLRNNAIPVNNQLNIKVENGLQTETFSDNEDLHFEIRSKLVPKVCVLKFIFI